MVETAAPARSATSAIRAPEHAVDADKHLVARLDQVDDGRFHSRRARPRDRHRQAVLRLKDVAKEVLHLIHERHELGIEVSE